MDQIDEALMDNIHMVVVYFAILCTTIGVVIRVIPEFAAIAGGLLLCFLYFFRLYISSSRALKEMSGTAAGSVVSHVSETLQGITVIQAYEAETRFRAENLSRLNSSQTASFNLEMLQIWLSFRLDLIGCLLLLGTCLLAVGLEQSLTPALAGLAISNSFQILLFFSLMVRGVADIDANIASVERVVQLKRVEQEKEVPLTNESCPAETWPSKGEIEFHDVIMSYLPSSPQVLKGVTFTINSGEKIGIVGRTGAGKSSLVWALFRLTEPTSGSIRIDGIDISVLNLTELRKRIAIIPQEPTMFLGTIRSNLDPFGEHTDDDLWNVLERCLLLQTVRAHPDGLNMPVELMGRNFSLGTQQLMCLARAMLNKSRLLVLDEATAALDAATDSQVQQVLRTHFADRTILTIAHRLDTIIDSDRILVMDAGRVAEFATPYSLLQNPDSIFASLCRQTGDQYETLRAAAKRHIDAVWALAHAVAARDDTLEARHPTTLEEEYGDIQEEDEDDDNETESGARPASDPGASHVASADDVKPSV
jgi:ATP-binding cassette subfamily C (CFTR/MRP) protein 1